MKNTFKKWKLHILKLTAAALFGVADWKGKENSKSVFQYSL